MARQSAGQRRHRGHDGDAVLLHHRQERLELEAREGHDPRARAQRRVEQDRAEDVRHREHPADDVVAPQAREREGAEAAQHRDGSGVRVRNALGQAGGTARAHEQRDRPRVDRRKRRALAGRERLERKDLRRARGLDRRGRRAGVGDDEARAPPVAGRRPARGR
jgi:hypothetical protein